MNRKAFNLIMNICKHLQQTLGLINYYKKFPLESIGVMYLYIGTIVNIQIYEILLIKIQGSFLVKYKKELKMYVEIQIVLEYLKSS